MFKKEWWAYRRKYHAHMRDELVRRTLRDKCMSTGVKAIVGDVEDLDEVWVCGTHWTPATTAQRSTVHSRFHKYRAYEHATIREFYSFLTTAMMRARRAHLISSKTRRCLV